MLPARPAPQTPLSCWGLLLCWIFPPPLFLLPATLSGILGDAAALHEASSPWLFRDTADGKGKGLPGTGTLTPGWHPGTAPCTNSGPHCILYKSDNVPSPGKTGVFSTLVKQN